MNSIKNRKGKFYIKFTDLNVELCGNGNIIQLIMGKVIIIRAESLFDREEIEYLAYSELFDEIKEGTVAPTYAIIVNTRKVDPDSDEYEIDFKGFTRLNNE